MAQLNFINLFIFGGFGLSSLFLLITLHWCLQRHWFTIARYLIGLLDLPEIWVVYRKQLPEDLGRGF